MVLSEMNKSVEKVHLMELTGILDGKIDPDIINKQIESDILPGINAGASRGQGAPK